VGGFALVAFPSAAAALSFALRVQSAMKRADWSDRLLSQPLTEEVAIMTPQPLSSHEYDEQSGYMATEKIVLFRGPRIKVRLSMTIVLKLLFPLKGSG
jgi:hypothetical protein